MNAENSQDLDSLKFWLALLRTPGIGAKSYISLLDSASPQQLFSMSRTQLSALGIKQASIDYIQSPNWASIESDIQWLKQPNHDVISFHDQRYPPQLKEIANPPPLLFVKGRTDLLLTPQLAIVGSRNPSSIGYQTAIDFAQSLANHGFTITSGLALGIDSASHEGALNVNGFTIAVTGTGLDRVYPARNINLATQIAEHGLLVSEFPPGTTAKANHFPRRNRIISGLCLGLLVIEAAKQSGSLITARQALDANREVFAIPGSIQNPLAKGCNALIKQGAKLVENTQDIFDELGTYNSPPEQQTAEKKQSTLDLEQQNLLNLVMYSPTSIDWLVEQSNLSVESVSSTLLMLELQGYIASTPGGYIKK